jgi:hypothetical protein
MVGVDASIANSLRRTLIAEVSLFRHLLLAGQVVPLHISLAGIVYRIALISLNPTGSISSYRVRLCLQQHLDHAR